MANPENLKPFTKGDPRRINKPKGAISMTTILKQLTRKRMIVKDFIEGKSRRMTVGEIVMLSLLSKAMKGDVGAIREINERMDGKVPQPVEMGNLDGSNFEPPVLQNVFVASPDAVPT